MALAITRSETASHLARSWISPLDEQALDRSWQLGMEATPWANYGPGFRKAAGGNGNVWEGLRVGRVMMRPSWDLRQEGLVHRGKGT